MKFEDKEITFRSKSIFEDPEFLEKLLEKQKKVIKDLGIDEKEFTDIYEREGIEQDLKIIELKEANWEAEAQLLNKDYKHIKQVSSLFETIIAEQIYENEWFGSDCTTCLASRFDDVENGIDIINVFQAENDTPEYLGLGADITFASENDTLKRKLENLKELIKSGSLAFVKYFRDPDTGEHKSIYVPKVIIGASLPQTEKLIKLWGSKDENRNKKLASHIISYKIILEIIAQLEYFYKYSIELSQNSKDEEKIAKYEQISLSYAKLYNIFFDIYQNKKQQIEENINDIEDDFIYETIIKFTSL